MLLKTLALQISNIPDQRQRIRDRILPFFWVLLIAAMSILSSNIPSALASIDNDRLDGNIFVVYAGNGSLVPSQLTLAESLKRQKPAILVFYLDDSRDCKQFAFIVSRIQEFYGRAASIIPISVDSIPVKSSYRKTEPGYYYRDAIPQTVILDQQGNVVFDQSGQVKYEAIDDALREVFDLLPRAESVVLKRRSFNEFNAELIE